MSTVDVAVGIILDPVTNKVLVAQRNTDDAHKGKWEFPGGKMDAGESAEQALKRELSEELGITVQKLTAFESLHFDYAHSSVNLNFFLVTAHRGQATGMEGQTISWIDLNKLGDLDMLEANHLIITNLQALSRDNQD